MKATLCVVMLPMLIAVVFSKKCRRDSDCFGMNCPKGQEVYCHFRECHCHAVHECHNATDCTDDCPIGSSPTCDNNHCHC
uniref:Hic7 n=1 Tax=Sinohyriopsis cumingii TaxID=165450 RepID=A0A8E2XHB7_SINCU|nr:hic7 [Sinohyriopsis cumingii]